MEKINSEGLNLIDLNVERLRALFPECFVDGKIDLEVLKHIIGLDNIAGQEDYRFNWNGKNGAISNSLKPSTMTLRPCKNLSKNWNKTNNVYIEGDNLETLKCLAKTYHKSIKAIYIDPPYNTGKDFVYHDDFHQSSADYIADSNQALKSNPETSGKYHTNWLNMMYPRLKLASAMLKEDGLIFISIDDNEFANLKKICDEIFGEDNFVAVLKWKKKKQPSFLSNVAGIMEYVVVYAYDYNMIDKLTVDTLSDSDKPIINASNKPVERIFEAGLRVKANTDYIRKGVYVNKSMSIEFLDDIKIENHRTANSFRAISRFRNEQSLITDFCKKDLIFITKNLGLRRDLDESEAGSGKTITDLLLDWGQNQDGSDRVKTLFEIKNSDSPFDNPKPVLLVKNLIKTCCNENDIVMDFFSGSGTTADAVMDLNSTDNLNLKYVLVQLPELCPDDSVAKKMGFNTICELGEKRISLAGDNIRNRLINEKKESELFSDSVVNSDNIDYGFKVFKLDTSNIKAWDNTSKQDSNSVLLLEDVIKEDRSNLDVAYEVMLKYGVFNMPFEEITLNGKTVYSVGSNYMIISLNNEIKDEDVLAIAKLEPKVVVFKESGFADDNAKINADYTFKHLGVDKVMCI